MGEQLNFVELRICLSEPAELTALVGAFAAIGNQFEEYIRREHRSLKGAAKLVVKDLRKGSIIVELMPLVLPLVSTMDTALIVDGFVTRYGGLLNRYLAGERDPEAPKSTIRLAGSGCHHCERSRRKVGNLFCPVSRDQSDQKVEH